LDAARIGRAIDKVRKLLKNPPRVASAKQVHDLRTNIRRLEATVEALSLGAWNTQRRMLRCLRRLHKRAGRVRDMDVLTGYVGALDAGTDGDCRAQLLEYLDAERFRQARKLHTVLRRDNAALRRRLRRTRRRVDKRSNAAASRRDTGAMDHTDVVAVTLRLVGDLATPTTLNGRTLLGYRVKVKRLRSVLQLASGADGHRFVEDLGRVKDAIGEWHDWEHLVGVAADVLDHVGCALVEEAKRRSRRKFERALGLTLDLRRRYLGARAGGARHRSAGATPTRPVLEATTAIAA
jgi:CHAD domain-containing protein